MTEQERFDRCLDVILRAEGGFVDDPRDPGGATNLGITRATLGEWMGHTASVDQVRALTRETVAPIYRSRYWRVTACDQLPAGVDLIVFDCAVNQGTTVAGRFLQAAAHVDVDGIVGPQTLAAVRAAKPSALIEHIRADRAQRYQETNGFGRYGRGWLGRLAEVAALAQADASAGNSFGADLTRKALEA